MRRFEEKLGVWIVRYRWWVILVAILLVLTAASGARFLTFSNDLRVFFSKENPQFRALDALENTYNRIDSVFFAIAPGDGNVFTRRTLAAIEKLTADSWKIPYSSRVDSITNFQHTRAEGDDLIVEDLVQDAGKLTDAQIERIRKIALSEPQLVNLMISPSGSVTGINVNILLPGKSRSEVTEVASYVRKMADGFRNEYPGIDIYLTGGIMLDNAFSEASTDDMYTLAPLMFLILFFIMGLSLRSVTGTLSTMIVILFSVATGMGLAGWIGIPLTTATAGSPVIILTLAVADSVHLLSSMFQQIRLGKSRHEAIAESLRINLQPVFITSITTTIGFLSMNFSDAPPFRDLGNIVAMGVTAAFVYSIFLLPALMAVLPVRIIPGDRAGHYSLDKLADFVINNRRTVFWGVLIAASVVTTGILKIDLNDNWIKYFSKKYDIRRATDFVEANLRGFNIIEYSLESGEPGGISRPDYLSRVDAFAAWYMKQPKVVHVRKFTDIMKRLNQNMHGDDESYYRIPHSRDLAAQYLLLYEMSLPFGHDLNNQINVDKSATRMTVSLKNITTRELRETDKRARQWLKLNAPSMFTYGTGLSIIWAHLSQRNIHTMLGASFWALMLISGIMVISLRSLKLGVVSLIPNVLPALMAFGVWGLTVGSVGLGLSVVASLTIGIVVDDTVHFMSKYIRARREQNMSPEDAVRYSFNTVGAAMCITTLILVAGFLVLTLSAYRMNSDMAFMTVITITIALVLDFLLLPVLLMKVDGKNDKLSHD
ncbi:nickel and cobalt resistance protein CnrA [bacterium BMS3Abin07]|nr:nickel and cobalt resistance protein CnrA [bacterium BMS3Abin07]GBE31919.1 nickel and cobalt resistance protein CnrA [bacterium BMS3Bbin05]HDL20480.1 RND family transporter [Nitrospirota bacterium]HDO23209.1 RND family transporter [Nitrospirota bacterium]HDZ88762.1 RND family transporter [Nitrospirota bacterium]